MLHPQMDMSALPVIGKMISHGYLSSGFLPVRIALPTLACMLLDDTVKVDDGVHVETFLETVSTVEAAGITNVWIPR